MKDVEEVIKRAEHYRFEEQEPISILNRISSLSTSKAKLKKSIIERINLLVASYISLATFIPDETVDFLIKNSSSKSKEKMKRKSNIYKKVLKDVEKLKKEITDQLK